MAGAKSPQRPDAAVRARCRSGVHHWLVSATDTVELSDAEQELYPGCIGRPAVCKDCGKRTVKREQLN